MKLAQRIVLSYYKNKIKAIGLVSPKKAAQIAFNIFCTPLPNSKSLKKPEIFDEGKILKFKINEYNIHGFKWAPEKPNGNKILVCHGFHSRSYKFHKYIAEFLNLGFEVFAFDAPAHGISSGKTTTVADYRDAILEIIKIYGPMDGIMAHSFGGLALSLALEKLKSNHPKRLVLIAPATETTTAIDAFFKHVPVHISVKHEFDKIIQNREGNPAEFYSVARAIKSINIPTLWLHDEEDIVTPFADMKHLIGPGLPQIKFEISSGLGHSFIYSDPANFSMIVSFFKSMVSDFAFEE